MRILQEERIQNYTSSIRRGVDYILARQGENGWIQPEGEKLEVVYVYNIPTLLCQAGELAAARRFCKFINENMCDPRDGLPLTHQDTPWATHTSYFKGWYAYGSHQLGLYGSSLKRVSALDRFVDHETGGVYVTERGARERTVTSFFRGAPIAMAMMITGRMDMAHKIGEAMLRTIFAQPDPENKFYAYADGKTGELITEAQLYEPPIFGFEKTANEAPKVYDEYEMDPACFCTDTSLDDQGWALYGPPVNFLMGMYDATGDSRYLQGCMQIFELFWKSRPQHSTHLISSCKILQGLPQMFLVTRDERILTSICELSDYLCQMQTPEGFWTKERFPGQDRELKPEDQQEWVKMCQIGDCGLSLQNVLKYLG